MRPRSRTLTTVYAELLNDVVFPSNISGRAIRVSIEGRKQQKVYLDPLDKELVEDKLEVCADAYRRLTTQKIHLSFSKPSTFQQKLIDQRAAKN